MSLPYEIQIPTRSSSAPATSTQTTSLKKGKCYSCGKEGHWAADCPKKSKRGFSQPNPSNQQWNPEIKCWCGAGGKLCQPLVAKTSGQVYYTCPASDSWMRCKFFMWRSQVGSREMKPAIDYPICDCGAGIAVLGCEAGRDYFKCRVPEGHGACSFKQWKDVQVSDKDSVAYLSTPPMLGKQAKHPLFKEDDSRRKCLKITELDGSPSTNCSRFSSNSMASCVSSDLKEGFMELDDLSPESLSKLMEYDCPLIEDDESSSKVVEMADLETNIVNFSGQLTPNSAVSLESSTAKAIPMQIETEFEQFDADEDFIDELIAIESTIIGLDKREKITYDSQMEEVDGTASAELHKHKIVQLRQANFQRLIAAAANELPQDKCLSVMLGVQYLGWLCRLAFASPRCMMLPLDKRWFCCIFPNFDPIYDPQALSEFDKKDETISNSIVDTSTPIPQESVADDVPENMLTEPSAPGSLSYIAEPDNVIASAILEAFGQAALLIQTNFISRLELMNPSSHESMMKEANTVFASLDHLKVDYGLFHKRVKDFIDASASLSLIEQSVCNDTLYQETLDRCNQEKLRLEQLSTEHSSVMSSVTCTQERVQTLLNEAEEVRKKLLQIEQQVSACQLQTTNFNLRLAELSVQIIQSENSLQRASLEAETAQKLSMQKEVELSAAWDVFEKAKFQLRDR